MDIINFEKQHVKEAAALAFASYCDERQVVKELPQVYDVPDLNGFAENGLGVATFEDEKMIGFLCCCAPFENAFRATDVRGIFSPMELIECKPCADYAFAELPKAECSFVYPLYLALYRHYCKSPFFNLSAYYRCILSAGAQG